MGLFDDIQIDYPIEGIAPFSDQTKELECYQQQYRIDEHGQLLQQQWERRPYTAEEIDALRKEHQAEFWKPLVEIWIMQGLSVNPRWVPANDTALLELESDEGHPVLIYLLDGKVKDVTVKPKETR